MSRPSVAERAHWTLRVAGAAVLLASAPYAAADGATEPGKQRQGELVELLHQDCGSCHGMRLTGGLGPPLTPSALAGKPEALLEAAILHGRPGTPMPPWAALLQPGEVRWLVHYMTGREGLQR